VFGVDQHRRGTDQRHRRGRTNESQSGHYHLVAGPDVVSAEDQFESGQTATDTYGLLNAAVFGEGGFEGANLVAAYAIAFIENGVDGSPYAVAQGCILGGQIYERYSHLTDSC